MATPTKGRHNSPAPGFQMVNLKDLKLNDATTDQKDPPRPSSLISNIQLNPDNGFPPVLTSRPASRQGSAWAVLTPSHMQPIAGALPRPQSKLGRSRRSRSRTSSLPDISHFQTLLENQEMEGKRTPTQPPGPGAPDQDKASVASRASSRMSACSASRAHAPSGAKRTPTPRHMYFRRAISQLENETRLPNEFSAAERFLLEKIHQKMNGHSPIARAFCFFDRRKNGVVSYEDFRQVLKEFGLEWGEQQTLEVFEKYDTNNKGYLLFSDFKRVLMRDALGMGDSTFSRREDRTVRQAAPLKHLDTSVNIADILRLKIYQRSGGRFSLLKAFKRFHNDKSDIINFSEFKRGCDSFGLCIHEEDLKRLFISFNPTEDGGISYNDFVGHIMVDAWVPENGLVFLSGNDRTSPPTKSSTIRIEESLGSEIESNNLMPSLLEQFQKQDKTGHGLITFPQFRRAFRRMQPLDESVDAEGLRSVFERHRRGQNEAIRYRDFVKHIAPNFVVQPRSNISEGLRLRVTNKDFTGLTKSRLRARPHSSRLP